MKNELDIMITLSNCIEKNDILTLLITLLRNSCNIMMFTSFAMIEIINSPTPSNHPRCIIPTSV